MASFMRTAIAPAARSSRAVTRVPSPFSATTMRSTRALKSWRSRARHRLAMTSEAILCLARDLQDFKARVERIVVAEKGEGTLVTARELRAAGAMAVLMKDAIKPNLVQTLEGTPALVHGGPFANIAHGCNSLIATRLGLKLGEILVTEAGFASDLGAEKFMDIKCRTGGLVPSAAVIVVTTRALGMH